LSGICGSLNLQAYMGDSFIFTLPSLITQEAVKVMIISNINILFMSTRSISWGVKEAGA